MGLTRRPYTSPADYEHIRRLLQHTYAHSGPPVYATVGDIDWWRWGPGASPGETYHAQLWWDEHHELAAILWPETSWGQDMQVDLLVRPTYRGIEDEMLAWAEAQQRAASTGTSLRLTTWAFTRDAVRTALFRKRGYTRTDEGLVYMSRSLEQPPPQRILPPGYSIRSVRADEDIIQRVAVHRAAFAPSQISEDGYSLLVREASTYRANLDLVVVAPDGSFAAFCLIWLDTANALGVFEPVGCHPGHQRRGLTRAVIEEGLRRLHDLGARAASLNSHRGDEAATRLYASTGFQEIDCMEAWQKVVSKNSFHG